jgi:hypothetical protein
VNGGDTPLPSPALVVSCSRDELTIAPVLVGPSGDDADLGGGAELLSPSSPVVVKMNKNKSKGVRSPL